MLSHCAQFHSIGEPHDCRRRPSAGHLHRCDYGEALASIRDALAPQLPGEIAAVGHRVVHGGASILGPALVDDAIVDEVDACAALAPLHNPANALGIRFARDTWGGVPHVVVPDTAFHTSSMQPEAFRYALPKQLYDEHGIRRYGFHGTSYAYVTKQLAAALGKPVSAVNAMSEISPLVGEVVTITR